MAKTPLKNKGDNNIVISQIKDFEDKTITYKRSKESPESSILIKKVPQTFEALLEIADKESILKVCIQHAIYHNLLSKARASKKPLSELDFALSSPRERKNIKRIELDKLDNEVLELLKAKGII